MAKLTDSKENCVLGFINLNKPEGFTSHDCVAKVRRFLKIKQVGHGGTLDPAATGVLPIAVGKSTRLLQYLPEGKAYEAKIRFGVQTTTDDLEGEIIETCSTEGLSLERVQPYLAQFLGKIEQIPPAFSAIQRDGKRLYELARAGKVVDVPSRIVQVEEIKVLSWQGGEFPELTLLIRCGAGTYIRAIARDLGSVMQTGGTLAALKRTLSCSFTIEESVTLDTLEQQIQENSFCPISPDLALQHLEKIELDEPFARRWCQGQKLPGDWHSQNPWVRVYDTTEKFLGIGELIDAPAKILKAKMVLDSANSA